MEPQVPKSSAGSSSDNVEIVPAEFNVEDVETSIPHQQKSFTSANDDQERNEGSIPLEPLPNLRKRSHELPSDEDNGERRVRPKTNSTLRDQPALEGLFILPLTRINDQVPEILKTIEHIAAVTGQIVALSSASEDPSRQTIIELLRGILSKLVPCVAKINDAKALGIEIVGLADLVDSSLQREGVFTISSPYASSVPKPLECSYDEYFAVGDIFWDRVTESAADPRLKPGEKVAPSSQGLVCVAYRLHLVTKVTPRNLWTAPGRLRGGKGVSSLNQGDHWMHAHLHNPDKGRLVNGRATGNGTPHHSLEFDPETRCRSQAVNENTHFCAVDAESHRPTLGMVPAGRLRSHSRDLFLGIKANAHSSGGNIVARPLGMDMAAVQRGLESAKRTPRHYMPLPSDERWRDHLYSQLDTHPSLHGPERLLRESSAFSSMYSASSSKEETQSPMASPPIGFSAGDQNPGIPPQTLSLDTSHARKQAPVQTTDKPQKDRRPKGIKVNTASAGQVEVSPNTDSKLQSGYAINQPSITAQKLQQQHNGAALNLSNFNAQEQNQNFNLSHNAPSLTPSANGERIEGGDTP